MTELKISERINIVNNLQDSCEEVFNETVTSLEAGLNETNIADILRQNFSKRGITEYWYDTPLNVLIGTDRFREGLTTSDYAIKNPSELSVLQEGSTLYIDLHPMDSETKVWGDWSRTIVFQPRKGIDDEELYFLKQFRDIQQKGISLITAKTTGADVLKFFLDTFSKTGITLIDVRNNVGHSLHTGPKTKSNRVWLDDENTKPLGEGIFAVEPGGSHVTKDGTILVARFEDSIYIPKSDPAKVLGKAGSIL